jgi:decaprenylphospho-beta-D-ribofuranose 2-oxidase
MTRLFGVILDVDIRLTENAFYEKRVHTMNWRQYPRYFLNNIKSNRQIGLHFAWPTVDTKNLFDEILVADFHAMNNTDKRRSKVDKILYEEKFIPLNRFVFGVSRRSQWGKKLRWQLQKIASGRRGARFISRNNAMRPEVLFLEHRAPTDTDLLQEYYFPVEKCKCFITLTLLSASNRQMQEFVVFFSYR